MGFYSLLLSNVNGTRVSSVSVVSQAEVGAPGVVVGVSVNGAEVWSEGGCLEKLQCDLALLVGLLNHCLYWCNTGQLWWPVLFSLHAQQIRS